MNKFTDLCLTILIACGIVAGTIYVGKSIQFGPVTTHYVPTPQEEANAEHEQTKFAKRVAHITICTPVRIEDDIMEFGYTSTPTGSYYYIDTDGLRHIFGIATPYTVIFYK